MVYAEKLIDSSPLAGNQPIIWFVKFVLLKIWSMALTYLHLKEYFLKFLYEFLFGFLYGGIFRNSIRSSFRIHQSVPFATPQSNLVRIYLVSSCQGVPVEIPSSGSQPHISSRIPPVDSTRTLLGYLPNNPL